jgi:hypothetical protein
MKTLFLAQIGRQLFAVDKACVLGVGMHNEGPKPTEGEGRRYLSLPHGHRAVICDMRALMAEYEEEAPSQRKGHYLIIGHNNQAMALAMSGKGRIVTADVAAALPLPPAFTGLSRALISGVLVNGADLLLVLNLQAVLEATDRGTGAGNQTLEQK